MNLIQPLMLWGVLAVAIPVLIHIWNKQKGKVIEWAATQWLLDKNRQQNRGIRLENIPLLLLRCLLVILLAFILSQPVLRILDDEEEKRPVHLVQQEPSVVGNYRFELEKALEKGEKIYWIGQSLAPITDLNKMEKQRTFEPLMIQSSVNAAGGQGAPNLYLVNNQMLAEIPAIYVPSDFKIHTVIDSSKKREIFKNIPKANVLLDYANPFEEQTVYAALHALISVQSFPLTIDRTEIPGKKYDWILADKLTDQPYVTTNYVISITKKMERFSQMTNVKYVSEPFQVQTSSIVRSGKLPEWLGEMFLKFYELEKNNKPLSQQQLNSLFVRADQTGNNAGKRTEKWLTVIFLCLLTLERIISMKNIKA